MIRGNIIATDYAEHLKHFKKQEILLTVTHYHVNIFMHSTQPFLEKLQTASIRAQVTLLCFTNDMW